MAKIRIGRAGEQIKKELSLLIQSELKDPRIGFITVTGVEVTGDLSQAKVYLSVFGEQEQRITRLKHLRKQTAFAHGAGQTYSVPSCSRVDIQD